MRSSFLVRGAIAGAAVLLAGTSLRAQATAGVRIEGDVPTPVTLSADAIRALPHQTVRAMEHGQPPSIEFSGVPLATVLAQAGVTFGATLRGPRLAASLLVEAADGYRATFALPELDSAFTTRTVLLVDRMNGQPLPPNAGPFRIVVPDEKRPARWVRQVTTLRIVAPPPATKP